MKNILFIFVLSLYSIQGYASSCPDGSEPVRSISADGTYFVFNCGGANEASSANTDSSNTKSNLNQAYQSFPVHEFAKSPLRDLKIPQNWLLFKDPSELDRFHEEYMAPVNEDELIFAWKMMDVLNDCERIISEFDTNALQKLSKELITPDGGKSYNNLKFDSLAAVLLRCNTILTQQHYKDRDQGIKIYERILLSWAKNKPVVYPKASDNLHMSRFGDIAYAATQSVGDLASFYAVYYDDFNFTPKQRQAVESYLSDWLINHDIDPPEMYERCVLDEPERFEIKGNNFIAGDYCGSNRWRMGLGAVYLGLRTNNQKLFTAGNRHIEINLASIDKDGIFPAWARKGALALSYQRQLPEVLTLLAVAYESIGYDFYEHQLPHGKKIHEVYGAFFDFIYHPEKLNKYAYGAWNFADEDVYVFDKLPLKEKWRREKIRLEVLIPQSKGYVLRYRPDLMNMIDYRENWNKRWIEHIAVFTSISGITVYEVFNQNLSKQKSECKKNTINSDLNGEYIAKWYWGNQNNNYKLEYQGDENLILEGCEGTFEGIETLAAPNMDEIHIKELRKKSQIRFQPDGQIKIWSDLNMFKPTPTFHTELKGNINTGIIKGNWNRYQRGDLIQIKLISKAKLQKEIDQCAKVTIDSELSGEYEAKWFFQGSGSQEPSFKGVEKLILDKCEGQFEGVNEFQPSKDLRKKLKISYQENGLLKASGKLDFAEPNIATRIELSGDIKSGQISGLLGGMYDYFSGDKIIVQLTKKAKKSSLLDGRYSFNLFRYAEDEADKIGNGFINISNGQITIDKKYRNLKTGETDLYDTFNGQVDKNGEVSGSVKLDIISSKERSEFYNFKGLISDKIWGESPVEDFFKVYLKLIRRPENETTSCNTKSFDGEYVASWFAESTKDDVGWEFVGKENIIFDSCKGKFEATEDFQPNKWFKMSKALRKDLNVFIRPDGTINIFGDLDLDYSEIQRINIKNNTQGGEVLGYFNPGWRLKVELKSK